MNYETLRIKELPELKFIAESMGLKVHHKSGAEKIISQILEISGNPSPVPEEKPKERPVPVYPKRDELREALAPYVERGLEVRFNEDDQSWYFSKGNRNDSGTINQPISVILRCADTLVRAAGA